MTEDPSPYGPSATSIHSEPTPAPVGVALTRPAPAGSWYRWLPVPVLLLVLGILAHAWWSQGPMVRISFRQGYGLKSGDVLRFRGIAIGEVDKVVLAGNLKGVIVHVRLRSDAAGIARTDTTFWVVRPQASLYGFQGLETLIGANYIGVLPGTGSPSYDFEGSEEQLAGDHAGDLFEFTLEAPTCANLRPGMPIKFKKFNIGRLVTIKMKHDLSGFRVRAAVEPQYKSLIRENTVFWNSSGLNFSFTLRGGIQLDVDSLQSILAGGVTIGVPNDPGQPVPAGHLFSLLEMPPSGWESWNPPITLQSSGTSGSNGP